MGVGASWRLGSERGEREREREREEGEGGERAERAHTATLEPRVEGVRRSVDTDRWVVGSG